MHLFLKAIKNTWQDTQARSKLRGRSENIHLSPALSFPPRRGEAHKPAVCNQSSQVGRPTTGLDPPVVEKGLRSDGCQHARNESEVQGSSERDRRRVGKCDAKTKGGRRGILPDYLSLYNTASCVYAGDRERKKLSMV